MYCTPGFSSQIEQEVRKHGPSKFNKDYSSWNADSKYEKYKEKFWEWMEKNSEHVQILQVLGGEPLYQKEFEQIRNDLLNPNLSEEENHKNHLISELYSVSLKIKVLQSLGYSFS